MSESHSSAGDYFKSNYTDETYYTLGSQSYITLGASSNIVIGLNTNFIFGLNFSCGMSIRSEFVAEEEFKHVPIAGKLFSAVDELYAKSITQITSIGNEFSFQLKHVSPKIYKEMGNWGVFQQMVMAARVLTPQILNWDQLDLDKLSDSDQKTLFGTPLSVKRWELGLLSSFGVAIDDGVEGTYVRVPWIGASDFGRSLVSLGAWVTGQQDPNNWWDDSLKKEVKVPTLEDTVQLYVDVWKKMYGTTDKPSGLTEVSPSCQRFIGEKHEKCFSIYYVSSSTLAMDANKVIYIQTDGDDFEVCTNLQNFM